MIDINLNIGISVQLYVNLCYNSLLFRMDENAKKKLAAVKKLIQENKYA